MRCSKDPLNLLDVARTLWTYHTIHDCLTKPLSDDCTTNNHTSLDSFLSSWCTIISSGARVQLQEGTYLWNVGPEQRDPEKVERRKAFGPFVSGDKKWIWDKCFDLKESEFVIEKARWTHCCPHQQGLLDVLNRECRETVDDQKRNWVPAQHAFVPPHLIGWNGGRKEVANVLGHSLPNVLRHLELR